MKGSIYRRGESYHGQYSINGKQIRVSLRTRDETEARRKFEAITARRAVNAETPEYHPPDGPADWGLITQQGFATSAGWLRCMFRRCKDRATHRGVSFRLQMPELIHIAMRSNGHCEVSGVRFSWRKVNGALFPPFAPSIDRIVPSDGYHAGNCRLVCYAANVAMSDWGEQVFESLATSFLVARGFNLIRTHTPGELEL